MFRAIGSVGLSWMKAHAGIPGNELADQLAKEASVDGDPLFLPVPYTFFKKFIKSYILENWQRHWDVSKSGVRVREFVPSVDMSLLTHNRFFLFFISGHSPFPAYLFRFNIFDSPNCICDGLGDADHFAFDCPHTSSFHFTRPAVPNESAWFSRCGNLTTVIPKKGKVELSSPPKGIHLQIPTDPTPKWV
ncbi:hypothetical protein AVEN_178732-1, partial [Araneus ventricosus]